MAELNTTDTTTADPCCAREQHARCCEPSAKAACCGHQEGCGCDAAQRGIGRRPKVARERTKAQEGPTKWAFLG
jgi:hypothetical protein